MKNRRIELDILKTIGFFMVFLVHYSQMFSHMNYYAHSLLKYGQTGCQLFLVVSGYLMSQSYEQGKMDRWPSYFRKRYISLFAGYILAVVLYCLISVVIGLIGADAPFKSDLRVTSILINAFMLNGIVPFCNNTVVPGGWYVGTMIIAYALIPLVLRKIKCLKHAVITTCIFAVFSFVVGILLTYCFHIECGNNTFYFYSIICQASPLMGGCSVYYYEKEKGSLSLSKSIIVFILFSVVTLLLFITDIDLLASLIPFTVALSFVGLYFAVKHLVQRLKEIKPVWVAIGVNSFGCYLLHFVFALYIPFCVKRLLTISDNMVFALLIIPCFILAAVMGIAFNKLIGKNSDFLNQKLDKKPSA